MQLLWSLGGKRAHWWSDVLILPDLLELWLTDLLSCYWCCCSLVTWTFAPVLLASPDLNVKTTANPNKIWKGKKGRDWSVYLAIASWKNGKKQKGFWWLFASGKEEEKRGFKSCWLAPVHQSLEFLAGVRKEKGVGVFCSVFHWNLGRFEVWGCLDGFYGFGGLLRENGEERMGVWGLAICRRKKRKWVFGWSWLLVRKWNGNGREKFGFQNSWMLVEKL